MSDSPRKLIRLAVTALLATPVGDPPAAPTVAGDRVYGNLAKALSPEKMPALAVYALDESPAQEANAVDQVRTLSLLVEPHHDFKDQGGASLDDFAWAVERALMDAKNLGLPASGPVEIREVNWQRTVLNMNKPEGLILGVGTVELEVKYVWVRPVEEMDLAPFERVHVDQLGLPPEEGGAVVEAHAELPQE